MSKDSLLDVHIILDAIKAIKGAIEGMDFVKFQANPNTQHCVKRYLSRISKASRFIPNEWKVRERGVPWRSVAEIAEVVNLTCVKVDVEVLWETVEQDLNQIECAMVRCQEIVESGNHRNGTGAFKAGVWRVAHGIALFCRRCVYEGRNDKGRGCEPMKVYNSMQVSLTPRLKRLIENKVGNGQYISDGAVIRAALDRFLDVEIANVDVPEIPTKTEVVEKSIQMKSVLRERGVTSLALIGSVARGDATPDSDINLLVGLKPQCRLSLTGLIGIKHKFEDTFGRVVNVAICKDINRHICKPSIDSALIFS